MLRYKDGYVSDITYTKGYYEALNPLKAKLVFLQQGQKFLRLQMLASWVLVRALALIFMQPDPKRTGLARIFWKSMRVMRRLRRRKYRKTQAL